jgi:hypothetical protein
MSYCENCGSKVYNGHCVYCHEEYYIMEQINEMDEPIMISNDFGNKLIKQEIEAKEIRRKERMERKQYNDSL